MSAALDIRPATEAEREWAARLMAASEPWLTLRRDLDACRAACHQPESALYVAHDAGGPCGFIRLQRRGVAGAPYVGTVEVAPSHRGRGVGTQLMRFAEDLFRPDSRFLFLCVSSFNTRARALYARLGYETVGELSDHVIDGAAETLMRKRL